VNPFVHLEVTKTLKILAAISGSETLAEPIPLDPKTGLTMTSPPSLRKHSKACGCMQRHYCVED